ncbi:MAG: 2Fe-2S iron-sulfur cluster-binding protein [Acidimicrobiia bacterium]
MPTIRVLPGDLSVEVAEGETLMAAAERAGLRWPTVCGGDGSCQTCFVEAREGDVTVPPPAGTETEGLAVLAERMPFANGTVRLACQFRPTADATVWKRGVKRTG